MKKEIILSFITMDTLCLVPWRKKFFRTVAFFFCAGFIFFGFTASVYAATYYWVGGTTNYNTSNPANWNTVVGACADSGNPNVPGSSDSIQFVSDCVNNATVDTALSVTGLTTNIGYTGTITASGVALTIGAGGLNIDGGMLNVTNGGTVINTTGYIGNSAGSNGTVTVDGAGSTWTNSSSLYVGSSGTGVLNILNGGAVSTKIGYIGYNTGSDGTVTVDGAGSSWTTTNNNIFIGGGTGTGTGTFTISNGGAVSTKIGYIGYSGGNGTVTVTGSGSIWTTNGNDLYVGRSGTGVLNISNGGAVSDGYGAIGYIAGSSNGTVTVSGTGSTWTNNYLRVGFASTGILNILNGGTVIATSNGNAGGSAGANGTVTVDGAGSTLTSSNFFYIGNSGTGVLNISNGGAVSNTSYGCIGYNAGSDGTVTIDGTGSTWTNGGDIFIGDSGTGVLTISDSGVVDVASGAGTVTIANAVGSVGTLNIGSGYTLDLVQAATITAGSGTAAFPPSTPTGFVTTPATTSIAWDWADADRATGYKVYNASDNSLLATISSATSTWTQDSLSPNNQHSIKVRGTNAQGEGWASATSSKYTLADTPTNLSVSSNSNSVSLSVDSLPNGTSGQSGYYFSRSGANSGWIQTNLWVDTELLCNHEYTYSVKYRNGDGTETSEISTTQSTTNCGSGMPSQWHNPPAPPSSGFSILIQGNASSTKSRIVSLRLDGGPDTKRMVISNFPDFRDAGQENYATLKQWDLCQGLTACPSGSYTVYAQFYTSWGTNSGIVSDAIVLNSSSHTISPTSSANLSISAILSQVYAQRPDLQQLYDPLTNQAKNPQDPRIAGIPTLVDWYQKYGIKEYAQVGPFSLTLRYGSRNQQVIWLQDILKKLDLFSKSVASTGYFGLITKQAVQKLQCQYKIVCSGNELTTGYGQVGPRTREALNQLGQ